ncbi:S66 peptidase family protein [Flindersiella endophytica]
MDVLKPPRIKPGDPVGVVATSSPVSEAKLARLVGYLEGRGHPVRLADGLLDAQGHVAGSAERRAAGVLSMFTDPDVRLVLPATGGWGAAHLVDLLDYDAIRADPKVFTGFSNPTALGNALLARAGLPNVHGTAGFQFFEPEIERRTEEAFWAMVSGPIVGREVAGEGWQVHRAAGRTVSGPVVGGNLPSILPIAGTRWMPSTDGTVLLLEAQRASFAEIDSWLTHLRLLGLFDGIAALVIGAPADWEVGLVADPGVGELVLRCVGGDFPVITDVPFGHQRRRIQFPLGCRVEFDLRTDPPVLRYLEDLVT